MQVKSRRRVTARNERTRGSKNDLPNEKKSKTDVRQAAFRRVIASIPRGRVASYGQVAAAAGYPLYHRAVAYLLKREPLGRLPWHRVLGSGGEIKLAFEAGAEQRLRLQMERVSFRGRRVNLKLHQHTF